ncbi:MAG: hypothetical protein ABJR46_16655, partial [Tateyamaria sp.]|uniref:hypothetical protein n=1 Tax=Tateyamaria sp. TaxID=1929288 RepID=UPI00329AE149
LTNWISTYRDLMHRITLEIFTEIWLPHNGLLASKLGKKVSTILGAIQLCAKAGLANIKLTRASDRIVRN